MADTTIAWSDMVWNPIIGCTRVSSGCERCYAERFAARFGGVEGHAFQGLSQFTPNGPRWTGEIRLIEDKLSDPLHWYRPRHIFVNSMSDLFHEKVHDDWLLRIWGVMAQAFQHTFQVLTKRPHLMLERVRRLGLAVWPNIWLGTSVEDQKTADERIPLLLKTPAAVRWISAEPLLGPLNLEKYLMSCEGCGNQGSSAMVPYSHNLCERVCIKGGESPALDWVVVGGESGPGARPFDILWARSLLEQCGDAGVPVFVKQLGAKPHDGTACYENGSRCNPPHNRDQGDRLLQIRDKKGGDPAEWPKDLRVREYPAAKETL